PSRIDSRRPTDIAIGVIRQPHLISNLARYPTREAGAASQNGIHNFELVIIVASTRDPEVTEIDVNLLPSHWMPNLDGLGLPRRETRELFLPPSWFPLFEVLFNQAQKLLFGQITHCHDDRILGIIVVAMESA